MDGGFIISRVIDRLDSCTVRNVTAAMLTQTCSKPFSPLDGLLLASLPQHRFRGCSNHDMKMSMAFLLVHGYEHCEPVLFLFELNKPCN